jgi:hypothetical protein
MYPKKVKKFRPSTWICSYYCCISSSFSYSHPTCLQEKGTLCFLSFICNLGLIKCVSIIFLTQKDFHEEKSLNQLKDFLDLYFLFWSVSIVSFCLKKVKKRELRDSCRSFLLLFSTDEVGIISVFYTKKMSPKDIK